MIKKSVLSLLLVLLSSIAHAQFVEEIGTLESTYESRARSVLNSFLRPHQYSVIVAAEIDNDQKKLDEYREKVELQYIPGLPIPMDPSTLPATNDLHSLKTKITISLILDQSVTPEKENLIKTVLASKLHLDESAGDIINISRASLPDMEPTVEKPRVLPEFSWKTWGLIVLISLLAFAGLILWLFARSNAKADAKEKLEAKDVKDEPTAEPPKEELKAKNEAEEKAKKVELELTDLKDQLLMLATQYPQISARAIQEILSTDEAAVVHTFEFLSWDLSRRVFSSLNPRIWGKLGTKVRDGKSEVSREHLLIALQKVYRSILARFLESGAERDDANPFAFISRLNANEKKQLLSTEQPTTFALISLYLPAEEVETLLALAPSKVSEMVPFELARLEKLPESTVTKVADRLKQQVQAIKEAPSIYADGPFLAAKILRSYSPEKEIEVLHRISMEDPSLGRKIRRINLQFDDLTLLSPELVASALTLLDVDQVVKALFGVTGEQRDFVLSLIPTKRARMIERDLENSNLSVDGPEGAQWRRFLCQKIEEVVASRGQEMTQIWPESELATFEKMAS